jgi:hypothetical protein
LPWSNHFLKRQENTLKILELAIILSSNKKRFKQIYRFSLEKTAKNLQTMKALIHITVRVQYESPNEEITAS